MRTLLAMLVLPLLVACSDASWHSKDIAGLMPELEFRLIDKTGAAVTAEAFGGNVVLLFFGFTHCPDVCPTTMARLAAALDRLDEQAERVRVLFVSVDPARDTPELLREYTQAFGPRFIGLRGDQEALRRLTKRYRVTYGYGEADASGNYDVSHSGAVFAFDPQGQARLLIRDAAPEEIAADLRRLVE